MLTGLCPADRRSTFTRIAQQVYTQWAPVTKLVDSMTFSAAQPWRPDCDDTRRTMDSLPKGKGHMPAIQTKVDQQIFNGSIHPFHPEGSEADSHCPACAMVDE